MLHLLYFITFEKLKNFYMRQKLKKLLILYLFTGTLFVSCTLEEQTVKMAITQKTLKFT